MGLIRSIKLIKEHPLILLYLASLISKQTAHIYLFMENCFRNQNHAISDSDDHETGELLR